MRISRPCYDKYHRCPGWNGGGNKFAKIIRCDNGHLDYPTGKLWKFRFNQCSKCKVIVWPYAVRYIDFTNLKYIPRKIRWWMDR